MKRLALLLCLLTSAFAAAPEPVRLYAPIAWNSLKLPKGIFASGTPQPFIFQIQNAGTSIGTFSNFLILNCSTGTTCSSSGSIVTLTAGGGGSGTVSANSGSAGAMATYAAAGGSTTVGPDALLTDASNILTYSGTGGISAGKLNLTGSAAGQVNLTQGTAQTAPTNGFGLMAPTSIATGYNWTVPTAQCAANGVPLVSSAGVLSCGTLTNSAGTLVATSTGTQTSGNAVSIDGSGNHVASGIAAANIPQYTLDTGAVNAYVVSPAVAVPLATGSCTYFKAANASTGTSTINVSGTGVKNLMQATTAGVANLQNGVLNTTAVYQTCYDGTEWVVSNPSTAVCTSAALPATGTVITSSIGISANCVGGGGAGMKVSGGVVTQYNTVATTGVGIPSIQASPAVIAIGSGTSIASTSLCSTVLCPAGTYRVMAYLDITTPCGTSGTYAVNLIYTDDAGSKTVVIPLQGTGASAGVITTTATANFGQADEIVRSTGAASINYSTTAVACGSAGPMVGNLYLSVDRVQ